MIHAPALGLDDPAQIKVSALRVGIEPFMGRGDRADEEPGLGVAVAGLHRVGLLGVDAQGLGMLQDRAGDEEEGLRGCLHQRRQGAGVHVVGVDVAGEDEVDAL